ncbi:MAG: hypothetical protein Q4B33_05515 [Fusobacterium sp.]|nr:hypothetical protein [Fusobacterium sp.]
MIKKIVVLSLFSLLLTSCTGIDLKDFSPIATKESEEQATNDFFNTPLETETGEKVAVDQFKPKSTKDYEIQMTGIAVAPKNLNDIDFEFGFVIKNPNKKIKYVKVQSVVPGDVLTFIDGTVENNNPNPNVKVNIKVKDSSKDNTRFWLGTVSNMPNIFLEPQLANKYLFKYTIKAEGDEEVVIYQPCFLPVLILNRKK